MNFLELCQDFYRENDSLSGVIADVTAATGQALIAVNDVKKAYRSIQNAHADWDFLRADVSFNTTAATQTYTATEAGITAAVFGEWMFSPYSKQWRCYTTSLGVVDEQPIRQMPYDDFKRQYLFGAQRVTVGRPLVITQKPDRTLLFWPTPDAIYTVIGEQYRAPYELAANADTPIFAARFHDVIVYRALMLYGERDGDQTTFSAAQIEFKRLMAKLEREYLPDITMGGAMA